MRALLQHGSSCGNKGSALLFLPFFFLFYYFFFPPTKIHIFVSGAMPKFLEIKVKAASRDDGDNKREEKGEEREGQTHTPHPIPLPDIPPQPSGHSLPAARPPRPRGFPDVPSPGGDNEGPWLLFVPPGAARARLSLGMRSRNRRGTDPAAPGAPH